MLRRTSDQCADRYERIQEPGVGEWHARLCPPSSRQGLHPGCGKEEWAADILSLQYACGTGLEGRLEVAGSIDNINTYREGKREEVETT